MVPTPFPNNPGWRPAGLWRLASVLLFCAANGAMAQTGASTAEPPTGTQAVKEKTEIIDSNVQQVSCPGCGGSLLGGKSTSGQGPQHPGCASCGWPGDCGTTGDCDCGGPCCRPGKRCCQPCTSDNWFGQTWCRFYDCICCQDPCYEPRWVAAADAGFFLDAARPITQFKLRYDALLGMDFPDRAEFFWAQTGGNGKGPKLAEQQLDSHDLYLISEVGSSKFSVTTEIPYRHVVPDVNASTGGFADIRIATKSLLVDCELMQFSFQMKTFIPTGNFTKGLGLGHVALEPSVLCTMKLTPRCYLQSQLAEWIPIGGDQGFQGSVLHYHFSLNGVLCRPATDLQVVGSLEMGGWHFQNGSFSDPAILDGEGRPIPQSAVQQSFYAVGAGLRLVMCDKMDVGVGAEFGLGNLHIFDQLFRTEFRYRF